jgi:hypothetical protein
MSKLQSFYDEHNNKSPYGMEGQTQMQMLQNIGIFESLRQHPNARPQNSHNRKKIMLKKNGDDHS